MSNFRKLPFLDKKWAKCDLNAALKNPDDLSWIFNNLIQDQELSQTKYQSVLNCCGNYSYLRSDGKYYCGAQVLNCSCCNGICNASSTCICVACQLIDQDDVNKKSPQSVDKTPDNNNVLNSETFFESWMWSRDTPDKDQKAACIKQLLLEQREICSTAAENCLSASTIKQLLYIYERHFIALARIKPEVHEEIPKNQENAAIQFTEKSTKYNDSNLRDSEKATLGLARVGTRAALNFSFAFLRRAWRSGEDTEMCSELLQDSLDALQSLPEASLFDTSNMSSLWIEAVEKSIKFLRQVVLGDGIPRTDRNISLNLLLELGIQKGTLSGSLEGILLLLTLWEKYSDNDDNRQSPQNANAPLYGILKRYQNINNYTMRGGMSDSHPCGPTESFLRFLTLPENDDIAIDLKQAAVIVMSHLDRLAKPHLPAGNYTSTKLQNSRNQQVFTLGYSSLTSETYGFTSEPSAEFSFIGGTPNYSTSTIDIPTNMTVDQIVCSENCIHILSTTGFVFVIDSQSQNEHSEIVQVVGFEKNVVKIAAHCEGRHYLALTSDNCVYSWGLGEGGRLGHGDNLPKETPTKIEFFADKEIVNIFCGAAYSAALSASGELYTWGRGTFGRLGHNNSDDKNIPTLVQALKQYRVIDAALGSGDSHTLCVTDTGNVFAWGDNEFGKCGYGQNCGGSQVPILIENLNNIYRIFSGSQFSVALSNDGCVYTWGKGSGGRLGHGSNHDHCYVPKKVQALEGKKISNMSVGSAHCLALLSTGELFGWGRNDYQQICPPCITRDPIISTPILTTPPFLRISGLMCGAAQSIVWCKSSTLGVPQRIPFVIDLCENTFRFLDQLLGMVCGSSTASENRHPPSQDAECIAVACLNIMRLQFHAIISNNISTKQVGLHEGSRLLNSLKSRILTLAGGCAVLKTIQEAAQWTLQIGWRILLPTPSERAQTLTSLLPVGCDSTVTTSGQRFMTSLLVGSLMTEGGLQTALNQAINSEQDCSSDHHLPLLHLLKQLLKNNSSLTMARLNQLLLGHLSKSNEDYLSSPESPSPSLDLLHKFQRLLLSYIYSSKNDDIAGAEALLATYLQNVVTLCVTTLTKAHEIILQNKEGVAEILQTDISDSLLYELLIGLVLLHKKKLILSSFNWTESLIPLLTALDNLNRLMADGEIQDTDDMGWPGIISRGTSQKLYSVQEEVLLIRKSDLENHIMDGGSWIIINGLVYDVKDYNCDNAITQELIMNNVGKDLTLELSGTQHRTTLEYITAHLRVGKFETNSNDEKGCQQCVRLTHFNSERTLAYLLGIRANLLQKSLELQPAEIQCEKMLNSLILRGGLQVLQPSNPFDEEKGEARSSGCSSTTTPTDADASNHLSIAEAPQMTNWPSLIISQRVEALLSGLGEARLTDPLVSSWIAISEKYCKENHLIWHQEFASDHPVIELERLLTAVLIRHQNLGPLALAVIDRELSGTYNKPPQPVADVIKTVHVTKWTLIKMRQQLNRSYKEVCAPMLEKCRFLLYEVRPAISLEQMGLRKLFLLYKSPRFKTIVQKIINEKRVAKIQMECAKFEDLLNVSIQSQNQQITSIKVQQIVNQSLEKYLSNENLSKAGSIEALNTRSSSPAIDLLEQNQKNISNENLLEVGLSDVVTTEITVEEKKNDANNEDQLKTPMNLPMSNDLKMKTIDFSEQFVNDVITKLSEKCIDDCDVKKSINNEIVDFVMQEFCDVETLRRAMYCQIQRYQTRKKGLEMFTELIKLNNLLDAVKYNLYNGYLNISCPDSDDYSGKNNLEHILENLNLVTAYQKSDILIIHSKIIEWAVKEFQRYVNQDHVYGRQRHHGDKDTSNLGTYVFLKKLSRARFLLSIFGILSRNFDANELSLLINSGFLGSTLGLLKQTGGNEIQSSKVDKELSVIYEDVISKYKIAKEGLSGPELAKLMKIGTRVARGADWKWGEQDGQGEGRIISEVGDDGWVRVEWDTGATNSYRMGKEGQYDLRLADSSFKVITPDKESEKDDMVELNQMNDGHPTKLLKTACIKMLQMVSTAVGQHADQMQKNSIHGFSSMFRSILNQKSINSLNIGFDAWITLGFLRSISSSIGLSKYLTSQLWINLFFDILRAPITSEKDVFKKVQCARLMQTTLVNWNAEETLRVQEVVNNLFDILGHISLYCPSDISLLHIPNDIKSKVLSSASHSGTIAEELIVLLRRLHTLPLWNETINSLLAQKLCIAADMFIDNGNEDAEKVYVIAALNMIGGCDPRPRLGMNVTFDGNRGTICRMTKSGKVVFSVHGNSEQKIISLSKLDNAIEHSVFSLSKLTINEILLNSWAVLIYGVIQKDAPVSNRVDLNMLKSQQIQLSALKATKVLYRHQNLLRNILRQRSPGITRYASNESICEKDNNNSDENDDKKIETNSDDSGNTSDCQNATELLIQSILARATQPSPLKACYTLQEMELAALNVSQMLSSHLNSDEAASLPMTRSRTILPPPQPTLIHGVPIYNEFVEDFNTPTSENFTNVVSMTSKVKPPPPLVLQIMEMGFPRKTVETALKSLMNRMEIPPTADQIVQYICDHPEITTMDLSKNAINEMNSISDTQSDSENSEILEGAIGLSMDSQKKFATRDDFKTADQYAMYVRGLICPGMLVRCCRDFEEIRVGDIGTVLKVEPDGLHDLSVRVDWTSHEHRPFWMCFAHLELLEGPSPEITNSTISIGSQVKIKPNVQVLRTRLVKNCIGTVKSISGIEVAVDFPQQSNWIGQLGDLELLNQEPGGIGGESYDIIDDWSRCIRSLTVSSNESCAKNLLEKTTNFWQSSSTQGRPWIRLEIHEHILIHTLSLKIDPNDCSHMPSLIIVRVGDSISNLKDFNWVSINPGDTNVTLLSNMKQYHPWIEILIKQCRNNGIQCRVHQLNIIGRRKQTDLDIMLMNASFLANDNDLSCEPSFSTSSNYPDDKVVTSSSSEVNTVKVMVWGLNDKEQLGGLKGSKVKIPTYSGVLSGLKPICIAGGSKSLFIVSQDGKLYACGEGTNGRLGLGHNNNVPTPRQVPVVSQFIVKKVAVHSGGKHAMALTLDGKVFSWGEGEDGKLGHGNRLTLEKPKQIEALKSKRIREIACGSSHSAAITASGELYTWGLGEYGRLGHGDNNTQLKPKLVQALEGHRVVQIACGSRDAQTLCLTEDGLVFSWGDGDFGKLGRGGSEGCAIPHQIERLNGVGVIQIECGAQFSLALTKSGEVWTWGKGDYYRLGHGSDQHVRKPTPIQGLRGKKVIHVAVGALHCLAVTDSGQVYAWGDNDHGQQGSGNTSVNKKPSLVLGLDGVFVNRVACGSSHSVAWNLPQTETEGDKKEAVPFSVTKDPLGGNSLGMYAADDETTSSPSTTSIASSKQQRKSLSEVVLSLESYGARQAALTHILNAIRIMQARVLVISALTSHAQVTNAINQEKTTKETEEQIFIETDIQINHKRQGSNNTNNNQTDLGFVAAGGGEGPADVSGLINSEIGTEVDLSSLPNATGSVYRSLTNSLSMSMSISSCNATQKHSKMSASAMSVMAATMNNQEEMINETFITGLDDFTSLFGESEARHLLELLKLTVSGRAGSQSHIQTIANTLIALGNNSSSIGNMILETVNQELEDLCTSRHCLGKLPKPIVQETSHPYIDDITLVGHVKVPGAEALRLEFDSQCSTEKRNDPLIIMDGSGRVIATRSGREYAQWAPEIRIPGDEMRWKFTSDNSVNGWGWRFYVHAVMPTSYLQELGSDRKILSQPSISMVMALLDSNLGPQNSNILLRLVSALAQCAQISSLTVAQRIWCLKKIHTYLTSKLAPKPLDPSLNEILNPLIPSILRQYEYEEAQVRTGVHLMHSEYFKTLIALACDMQLDTILPVGDTHKWAWFKRYCSAVRVAQSLIRRTVIPKPFCLEVRKKLSEMTASGNLANQSSSSNSMSSLNVSSQNNLSSSPQQLGAGGDSLHNSFNTVMDLETKLAHEDHEFFTLQYDSQLLQWFNRRPEDWAFSWGGASTIFGWGHNHRGQLGGLDGSRIKIPTPCEALSLLRPVQIAGGEQTLYAVTIDGKVYATGYGAGGRLGIGGTDSVSTPTLIESLQHVLIKKVAVNSGGKHCLALSADGEVFSWGEGEDGKLGHGNRDSYDRPKLIESLSGIGVVDIACGSAHSACITSQGHVLTWGKGRYGRLGHGDSEDQLQPKVVEALLGYRAVDIACGSGDAQTLCITDDDNVWSWGDGDYGKLGRGGSDGCKSPMKIDSLAGLGVTKVECGSQFSVALTRSGAVYTWGKGDYHRLGHGNTDHVRRPKKIAALQGKKIVSIATGSLHCIACSDQGEVFTWGDNDEGQLGDGTVTAIQRPRIVSALSGKHIVKVICGSAHTLAISTCPHTLAVRSPPSPPLEYDLVREISPEILQARLVLLHHFSELLCPCLAMLPIDGSLSLGALRDILVYSIKEASFRKVIQTTMVRDKPHGPIIELNRIQVKRSRNRSGNGFAGIDGMKSVFGQMVQKLPLLTQEALSMPHRVWKVKFVGESVDDCGGGFSESIAEMCDELQNGSVPLLIQTPNGRGEAGANRDCFLLDPTLNTVLHMNMFRFLGVLMGIAVRTGSPLSLNLAEPVWRQLAGEQLRPSDLTEVDRDYVTGLLCIRDMDDDPKVFQSMELPFSTPSAKGHEVQLSTKYARITPQNRQEYVKLALNYRLHEFDEQVKAVRDGMSKVVPVPLLSLFSASELQAMVCGSPDIPLGLLKTVATYKGVESTSSLVQWFWEVMEEFTNQERSLFLRFVWGRTRLPRTIADFRGRDFVLQVLDKYNPPDHFLPESYTCFFLLKMPRYSCKAVLMEKLKYAIHFCKSIDTDDYARVAIGDPTEQTGSEDNSDIESIA